MKAKILMMALAGMVILAACKNRGSYEADNSIADTAKLSIADTAVTQPKLVKTAGIDLKVKSVKQTSEKISALTAQCSGMVIRHRINSNVNRSNDFKLSDDSVLRVSAFTTAGEMTVKIPAEKLDGFMNDVGRLGIYVTADNIDIEDKSLDYLSSRLKLNSRQELVKRQKQGKIIIKEPSAVLNLKDDMVDEQISNRKIDDAVKYSVVSLNMYQSNTIMKEVVANDDPGAYNLSFFSRLNNAFDNGWLLFKELLLVIANLWVFVTAGFALWMGLKTYKQRTAAGLLKQ